MKHPFATLIIPALLAFSGSGPRAAASAGPEPVVITPLFVDRLVEEASRQNPSLRAAGAQAEASGMAVEGVRTWEDPTASFGLLIPSSRDQRSASEGNLAYGLEQKLPLYGRPALMRQVAAAAAAGDQLAAGLATYSLRRDLVVALHSLALAGREAEVAAEDLGWVDATLAAVDHRYRVGQATQVDWLKIQTARAVAADDLITREREREHRALALNRLLNRDLHQAWPRMAVPPLQPPLYYTPSLVAAALSAEPRLKVLRQESVSAQAAAALTHRQRLPDVSIGVEARQYSGDGGIREGTATVSFSVPWLNRGKYDHDWRRDQQRKRASDYAALDYALSVREELHHQVVDLDTARRQALLYRDQLIPLTEQTLRSAQTAWEQNLGPFQDILETHRMALANQLALARALTEQATVLAQICFLTGSRDEGQLVALAGEPVTGHEPSASNPSP